MMSQQQHLPTNSDSAAPSSSNYHHSQPNITAANSNNINKNAWAQGSGWDRVAASAPMREYKKPVLLRNSNTTTTQESKHNNNDKATNTSQHPKKAVHNNTNNKKQTNINNKNNKKQKPQTNPNHNNKTNNSNNLPDKNVKKKQKRSLNEPPPSSSSLVKPVIKPFSALKATDFPALQAPTSHSATKPTVITKPIAATTTKLNASAPTFYASKLPSTTTTTTAAPKLVGPPLTNNNSNNKSTNAKAISSDAKNKPTSAPIPPPHPKTRHTTTTSLTQTALNGKNTTNSNTNDLPLGQEHALLRLMQEGKMVVTQKGRQRIRPRRKKFSPLKKKVLEERLRQWRQKNPDKLQPEQDSFTTLAVLGWLTADDDCNDDDEYQELCQNFQEMAEKIGTVQRTWLPRREESPVYVQFQTAQSAEEAQHAWNGLNLGGAELQVMALSPSDDTSRLLSETEDDWRIGCERAFQEKQASLTQTDTSHEIGLWNVLTDDDLEDDECLEECVNDIRVLATSYGPLATLRVEKEESPPRVVLEYTGNLLDVKRIVVQLNQVKLSGNQLLAKVLRVNKSPSSLHGDDFVVVLRNVLTTEDLEDEDCLEESMVDIEELAKQFGVVEKIDANIEEQTIWVHYTSAEEKQKALTGFHGMVIGGQTVSVTAASGSDDSEMELNDNQNNDVIEPMFSGDKRIPERFAECKRVPKIPNSGQPRHYAILSKNETVKPLLMEMLAELMRLQKRAAEDKNAKAKRRLVMGLREVARGIRARKVRMVVMANNLDEYGALDEKLQEILDLAQKEEVPVFFEFSKRSLGKAIGKTIKMAVIGIQNPDGANQQFKKLSGLATPIPVREP
ncbi:hypothetical protein FisN_6Lh408 [Fistulifera solaris]|uniref:Ribosomal protein eL8/eL30/eS12/Gadd45 domain-containing protein n=1 Tax=Fistulifera solaris TaxID=1519565 RepID=A0A1Z5JKW5_FISSO|nr:hypothetical protein FisN_6Lh408 [Fistulifera solaris]|eukprot:GAX14624.1 hypothetical protein FisN_6Lh408 [Fistulifera solaris]